MFPARLERHDEFEDTLGFFQNLLRSQSVCRLNYEYPLAFDPTAPHQIYVSRSGSDLTAGLVTLQREIEVQKDFWAKALFIGSVVTVPEFRNRGLQRQLFHAVEEVAENSDIDFIVLWSNQIAFYEKLGFQLGGLQATWMCPHKSPIVDGPLKVKVKVEDSSTAQLTQKHFEAFDQKKFRVRRSFEEIEKLWRIPKMTVAYTENAYALMGKGEDFAGICHEWAGPATEVLGCVDALREIAPDLKILSPGVIHDSSEAEVIQAFERASFESRLEYLGLFKLISKKLNAEKLVPEELEYPFFIWGLDSI